MSVGGTVVQVTKSERGTHISVAERKYWGDRSLDLFNATAIVVSGHHGVMVGDVVWWHGDSAFWTRRGEFVDRKLVRVGPSHRAASAESILDEAARVVHGPRRDDYGTPKENHTRTAALWSAYLGVTITPRQVCELNILQKVSRDAHSPKRDNLVDIAGWARNAELCEPKPGA